MRPVSERFLSEIALSHQLAVSVEVLSEGEVLSTLDVIGGSVDLDGRAETRGRLDITLADEDLVPAEPTDLLAPYGNELRVSRGIAYTDATQELASLGVFRIDEVEPNDTGEIRIIGLDRSIRVIEARFEEPYEIARATLYTTAILETVQNAYPDVAYDFADSDLTTPKLVAEEGDDRWAFCQSMATAMGMDLYFDGDGTLVLRPTGSGSAVAELIEGEDGVLIEAARRWNREGAFNRVIATGENTGETAPARGVATDENPLSPTYYYGAFGKVPRFYSSPFIATDDQAADAAESILAKELGTTRQVEFGAVVNPALEPGDVVRIAREQMRIDEDHTLDRLAIPLGASESMNGATRAIQVE